MNTQDRKFDEAARAAFHETAGQPPAGFDGDVMGRVKAEVRPRVRSLRPALAAAAAFALLAIGGVVLFRGDRASAPEAPTRQMVSPHESAIPLSIPLHGPHLSREVAEARAVLDARREEIAASTRTVVDGAVRTVSGFVPDRPVLLRLPPPRETPAPRT